MHGEKQQSGQFRASDSEAMRFPRLIRLAAAAVAVLLMLTLEHCLSFEERSRPTEEQASTARSSVNTMVLPDRWIELARLAKSEDCDLAARMAAVREMARAGPYANLVLPALRELVARGPPPLQAEARASLCAIFKRLAPERHPRD
jgi:hypothetical protein